MTGHIITFILGQLSAVIAISFCRIGADHGGACAINQAAATSVINSAATSAIAPRSLHIVRPF